MLKHIIKCYYRLSENSRAQVALIKKVPAIVKCNSKIFEALDDASKKLLMSLIESLNKVEDRHRINGSNLDDSLNSQPTAMPMSSNKSERKQSGHTNNQ